MITSFKTTNQLLSTTSYPNMTVRPLSASSENESGNSENDYTWLAWLLPLITGVVTIKVIIIVTVKEHRNAQRKKFDISIEMHKNPGPSAPPGEHASHDPPADCGVQADCTVQIPECSSETSPSPEMINNDLSDTDVSIAYSGDYSSMPDLEGPNPPFPEIANNNNKLSDTDVYIEYDGDYSSMPDLEGPNNE